MKNLIIKCIELEMYDEAKILTEAWYNYFKMNTGQGYMGVTIFINPSEREISKNIPANARAFIDIDGNLYCEGYEMEGGVEKPFYATMLHEDFIKELGEKLEYLKEMGEYWKYQNFVTEDMIPIYGVAVVIDNATLNISLATYYNELDNLSYRTKKDSYAEIQKIYDKCKEKNSHLNFWLRVY